MLDDDSIPEVDGSGYARGSFPPPEGLAPVEVITCGRCQRIVAWHTHGADPLLVGAAVASHQCGDPVWTPEAFDRLRLRCQYRSRYERPAAALGVIAGRIDPSMTHGGRLDQRILARVADWLYARDDAWHDRLYNEAPEDRPVHRSIAVLDGE